jgi:hypothetical protein
MSGYCFTLESEERTLTIRYSHLELKCLGGPLLPSGGAFQGALGLWDNFSVAKGMDTSAWTIKPRMPLLRAAQELLAAWEADRELLQYDYQYSFSSNPKQRNTGGMGITFEGRTGIIDARRPGQIFIRLVIQANLDQQFEGNQEALLDLRKCEPLETPMGTLKLHRRRNNLDWEPKLTRVVEFLSSLSADTVRIRHHYPE